MSDKPKCQVCGRELSDREHEFCNLCIVSGEVRFDGPPGQSDHNASVLEQEEERKSHE